MKAENIGLKFKISGRLQIEKFHIERNFQRVYSQKRLQYIYTLSNNALPQVDSARALKWQAKRQYKIEHSFDRKKFLPMYLTGFGQVAATHVASLIVLFSAPKEYTKWDYGFGRELIDNADHKFRTAWTSPPINDKDNWNTNWVAHPYVGGYYYNFVRSNGASPLGSFLFSTFASTSWEYGVEAMFEHPSIQDLWITPVIGSLVGEASHQIALLLVKNKFTVGEKLLLLLINPPYFFNHGFKVPREKRRKQLRQWNTNKEKATIVSTD